MGRSFFRISTSRDANDSPFYLPLFPYINYMIYGGGGQLCKCRSLSGRVRLVAWLQRQSAYTPTCTRGKDDRKLEHNRLI